MSEIMQLPTGDATRDDRKHAQAFRDLEEDIEDLHRMSVLGLLAINANEDRAMRFALTKMGDMVEALKQRYYSFFDGDKPAGA
jgi:hypothetical protein